MKTIDFIAKAEKVHGKTYFYSKTRYVSVKSKVTVGCLLHGDFEITPNNHLNGKGCRACGWLKRANSKRLTTAQFIKNARKIHGDLYDYTSTIYISARKKVSISCATHGEFLQTPRDHTTGCGCPMCASKALNTESFIKKAISVHGGKYSYTNVKYVSYFVSVIITCREHGNFEQTPSNHLAGYGCKQCSFRSMSLSTEDFITRAKLVHGDKYDYSLSEYVNSETPIRILCNSHGEFVQRPDNHLSGKGCQPCSSWGPSDPETELSDFVESLTEVKRSDRTLIAPQEIDCLVRSRNLGIEFCGLYFHSDKFKENTYHLDKLKKAQRAGIDLIQVFEDEWREKSLVVKSIIRTKLGLQIIKRFARKTELREISLRECSGFMTANHLQGYGNAEINLGLFENDVLVMAASFSNKRKVFKELPENWYELVRLCTVIDTIVVGGFSKLLKYFIKKYNPSGIKTFCDLRYFNGVGYEAVGFTKSHISKPDFYYLKAGKRYSRFGFQKHKLENKLEKFDRTLSEAQNMYNNGYYRIYGCGNLILTWRN